MRQVEAAGQAADLARLGRGLGAQAVIDGDGNQARTARQRAAPARGKPHQRDRIGPAGYRKDDRGRGFPVREQAFGIASRDRSMVVVGHGVAG